MRRARNLTGKVVVITGGGRGVGAATARLLRTYGARIAVGDLDEGLAAAVAVEVDGYGAFLDVTDRPGFTRFLDDVEAELGAVDVLINNAGIMPLSRIDEESDQATNDIVSVNLLGVIHGTKQMVARMKRRGAGGHIVNVSSAAGRIPIAGAATYTATKHAVSGFSNALHIEFLAEGTPIDITAVHPAIIRTELSAGFADNKGPAKPVTAEQVAAAIVSALHRPRPDVYVPASLGTAVRTGGLIPRRVGEWLNRVLGGERAALDASTDPARTAYEERAAHSAPAAAKHFRH
jgi:NADP-dependent 3-hydroxy acid dehydrogenase YdfG